MEVCGLFQLYRAWKGLQVISAFSSVYNQSPFYREDDLP
jgi:hypothetical protein